MAHSNRRAKRTIGATSALVLLSSVFVSGTGSVLAAGTASAETVGCGQTITHTTVLTHDVGPCPPDTVGITVAASHVTLDLNGHRVFGSGPGDMGTAIGILLNGTTGVTVTNGSVDSFDGGVVVQGGAANTITNLNLHDNIGPNGGNDTNLIQYGDGILVEGSNSNRVVNNLVQHNGPLDGVAIIGVVTRVGTAPPVVTGSSRNLIANNRILNNNAPDLCPPEESPEPANDTDDPTPADGGPECTPGTPIFQEDFGIRLEGPADAFNTVVDNLAQGNGLNGIAVNSVCVRTGNLSGNCLQEGGNHDNSILNNTSSDNGFGPGGAPGGYGIRLITFNGPAGQVNPVRTTIDGNTTTGNAIGGISIGKNSLDNTVMGNTATGNNVKNSPRGFDLTDQNLTPPCDHNVWRGDRFGTANQSCIH